MNSIKSIQDLKQKIKSDSDFVERLVKDPISTLEKETNPISNPKVFKIVLYFVGIALIFCLVIAAIIALSDPVEFQNADGKIFTEKKEVDQFFVMIGSAAIGALAGLLVPRPD